jgi:uncharacterized membrane protein YjgN (DUF898 family)
MPPVSSAAVPAATAGERVVRPEFTGTAREYFRIWIVNLFFTLITLGVYSAWAKVRKKRYFYGSTKLDGDSFDYFASPKAILKGRIVAFVLLVVYAFSTELYPASAYGFWAAFALALPWLVVRALAFNARNSAWRGLRFDFAATPRETVGVYIGMPLVVLLTAGLAYPWFMARQKSFVVSRHALGESRFACEAPAKSFFAAYLIAGLLALVLLAPIGFLMAYALSRLELPEAYAWAAIYVPIALMYVVYALVYAFLQARTANLVWNAAYGPGVRFGSTLSWGRLARLYVGNVIAAAATAGLLIPWAVVRTLRYRLENFSVAVDGDPEFEANPALERVGATGQEFGDIFNIDFGL